MWGFAHLVDLSGARFVTAAPQKGKSARSGAKGVMVLDKRALLSCVSLRRSAHQALVTTISHAYDFAFTKWSPAISHALE